MGRHYNLFLPDKSFYVNIYFLPQLPVYFEIEPLECRRTGAEGSYLEHAGEEERRCPANCET